MVNTQKIDEAIEKSGLKVGFICEKIGITRQGFDLKKKNKRPFRKAELFVLFNLLGVPDTEQPNFFTDDVALKGHKGGE